MPDLSPEIWEPSEIGTYYRTNLRPVYQQFADRLHGLIGELTMRAGIPIDHIESRAKSVESFLKKIERKSFHKPFEQIKDFAGIRLVAYYLDSVDQVADLIRREFDVDSAHSVDKIDDLATDAFGYRSIHLVVSLSKPRSELEEWRPFAGFAAEIQIRSVLQHAWAVLSHTLDYKASSQIPRELRRELFRLSAQLEKVDEDFMELLKQADEISAGYERDMARGELDLPLDFDSLKAFVEQKVMLPHWEEFGVNAGMEPFPQMISSFHSVGLEILLLTLQAVGVATVAEFEQCFPRFETMRPRLEAFVQRVKGKGKKVHAVPVDVLILLVSLLKSERLPSDFDWGGKYSPFFVETLREVL